MKKNMLIIALLIAANGAFAAPQKTCPVMGGKVNKELYIDAEGYRIYVCCKGCISAIQADPEKYIEKLKADDVEIEKTPKK
jgi:hypothetical protein